MKTKIITVTAILLILAGGMTSCTDLMDGLHPSKKNTANNQISFEKGLYVEVEPFRAPEEMGHVSINFIDEKRLVITKYIGNTIGADVIQDELTYEISENTIKLTCVVFPEGTSSHHFRVINHRKFEIGYLHMRTGFGEPPPPMTFERKD